jgi:hypothetical protein
VTCKNIRADAIVAGGTFRKELDEDFAETRPC